MTLAEQVAELERERDALRGGLRECERQFQEKCGEIARLLDAVATAQVEGAREALSGLADEVEVSLTETGRASPWNTHEPFKAVRAFRDREYPAPTGEGVRTDDPECYCGHPKSAHIYDDGACRPGFHCLSNCAEFRERSTPPSAPEPHVDLVSHYGDIVRISPADARRIVEMAQGGTDA